MKKPLSTPMQAISGPTAPVPKDPQPSVDRIDELARRIISGDILLPKFQRSFVWERKQILTLLDSVARGYPIGSVLLWQSRQELRSESSIADLDIELPRPDYPVNYLLDGQQRLSAICGAMFWNGDNPKSRWNIVYDLRAQTFLHQDTLDDLPPTQIRVNKISDPASFFKHVAFLDSLASSDKGELQARAEVLFNRFKDYKIATVTLGDMSIQDVAPIFERINSTGTPLTIVDLMRAATWSPEFDLIDSIEGILEELEEKGFGNVDKKVLLRNLSAAVGGGFSADSIDQLRNYTAEELKSSIDDVHASYKRMVDFLTTQIRIPSAQVIPYANQLTVLGEVFRRFPVPNAEQYNSIAQWFWKTSVSGYFGGWNTGMMADDLKAIKEFASGNTGIINLVVSKPSSDLWKTRQFRLNNAHAKLLAIVLAHHAPIDIINGQRIDISKALSWTNSKEYHHFFPQAFLKKKGISGASVNSLANIILLTSASNKYISDRAPSDYLQDVQRASGVNLSEWLKSNLISDEAYNAALNDDFDLFLEIRSKDIHREVLDKTDWK